MAHPEPKFSRVLVHVHHGWEEHIIDKNAGSVTFKESGALLIEHGDFVSTVYAPGIWQVVKVMNMEEVK